MSWGGAEGENLKQTSLSWGWIPRPMRSDLSRNHKLNARPTEPPGRPENMENLRFLFLQYQRTCWALASYKGKVFKPATVNSALGESNQIRAEGKCPLGTRKPAIPMKEYTVKRCNCLRGMKK